MNEDRGYVWLIWSEFLFKGLSPYSRLQKKSLLLVNNWKIWDQQLYTEAWKAGGLAHLAVTQQSCV